MNINDYLKTPPSFSDVPYNKTDDLIFATISYLPMDDIVPASIDGKGNINKDEAISIGKMAQSIKNNADNYNSLKPDYQELVDNLIDNPRYKDIKLNDFMKVSNPGNEEQFAAVTISLPDGTKVVSFRGTDGTMHGWKEDFNLAWSDGVPAQIDSTEYLNTIGEKYPDVKINITGHSKGGHLGVYSAITCNDETRARIGSVSNFDGPGIQDKVLERYIDNYCEIKDKIISTIPQTSIIGRLLTDYDNTITILSSENGIMQHDQFSWEIDGNGNLFINPKGPNELSDFVNETLDDLLASMTQREREVLVETLFLLGGQGGVRSFDNMGKVYIDYFNNGDIVGGIEKILKDYNDLSIEQKEVLMRALSMLLLAAAQNGAVDYLIDDVDKWAKDTMNTIGENLNNFKKYCIYIGISPLTINILDSLCDFVIAEVATVVKSFLNYIKERITGDTGSIYHGPLKVNIDYVYDLARTLNSVQNRIMNIDRDLDDLRSSLEWYEIIDSLRISGIDFLFVGYDYDLKKCIDYLNYMASKLDACETKLNIRAKTL